MRNPDQDILLFFSGHEEALGLYEIFEDFLYSAFPDANRRVQKTQITFFNRHVFACVSFARVRKKADLPKVVRKLVPRNAFRSRIQSLGKDVKDDFFSNLDSEKTEAITDRMVSEISDQIEHCLIKMAEVVEIPLG